MSGPAVPGRRALALTGATGFIGSVVLLHLRQAGWSVRALYRPRRGLRLTAAPGVTWIPGDVGDDHALARLVEGAQAVVHCAGAVRGSSRAAFDRVNEDGTRRVVMAAARAAGCGRFLLLSSLAAREPALSDYAGSKWRGERALAAHAGDLDWTVLRPPAVFGPGDRELLPLFRSIGRGFAPLPARARGRFSLLYADDLAAAIVRWLTSDIGRGGIFELDDGRVGGYDWDTVLDVAARVLRAGQRVRRIPVPRAALALISRANLLGGRVFGYAPMLTPGKVRELTHADWVCDNRPFVNATGWHPAFGLGRGLACTFGRPTAALHGVA